MLSFFWINKFNSLKDFDLMLLRFQQTSQYITFYLKNEITLFSFLNSIQTSAFGKVSVDGYLFQSGHVTCMSLSTQSDFSVEANYNVRNSRLTTSFAPKIKVSLQKSRFTSSFL